MKIINKFYKHFVIFILMLLVMSWSIDAFFQNQKDKYLDTQTELLQGSYKTQYNYLKIMSHDIYLMYQENEKLIPLFAQAKDANLSKRAKIRKDMYTMLLKRYKRLENMGVRQLHFHLPDNTSFLRMNKPEKFGDNLTLFRESVAYVNATKKEIENFEVGKLSTGFRFVFPLFDRVDKRERRRYIGSVEVSFSEENLLNNITDKFVLDKHFLVLKSEVIKNGLKDSINTLYEDSLENRDFFIIKDNFSKKYDEMIEKILLNGNLQERIYLKMKNEKPFSIDGSYNFNSTVITFLPIKNKIKKRTIAYLVLYFEADYIDSINADRYYTKLLLLSLIVLLFLFTIYATLTQQKLREMAHFDKLTQLPNRAYFYIELAQEIKRAKRLQEKLSVMFVDLDGFKIVNDTYGHNVGDELLIRVARRLQKSIRNVDIVGRIGGDEFTILLTGIKSSEDCKIVAEKIIKELNKDFVINHNRLNISASIGVANFPEHGEDLETLINNADNAMYEAKNSGKNRFVLHTNKK